ncbi:fibronectin type III domain-containing protein [Rhodococcus sp. 5A-K4]|uniref:fibronectin type III domain-containing protein n=1 Tax=Rhodococcus sp. 5A-K4 TaxID=3384442 RepID=UPI0038D442B8
MPTTQTWDSMFGGNPQNIFKGLYGSFLVKDYDPNFSLANYTPFDSLTGQLKSTILTTDGWIDTGYLDENGVEFSPNFATADTKAWQSRQSLRTDCTDDSESCSLTALESKPLIDALENNLPIASMGGIGQVGYQFTKSRVPVVRDRQILFIGVDYTLGQPNMISKIYSRAQMTKPDKKAFQAKTEVQSKLMFNALPDALSGFAVRTFREGAGWRALGGTTSAPGTPVATALAGAKATLAFTAPDSPNGPFTYNVFQNGSVVPVVSSNVTVGGTSAAPVLTISGLTASTAYTFTVQAVGGNLSGSVPSAVSNSVTAIA